MNVWVAEVIYEQSSIAGVFSSLDKAVQHVRDRCPGVKFDKPANAMLGSSWIMRGVWDDRLTGGPRFVTYRFTHHDVLDAAHDEGSK
jgi:hypothetical protein